MRGGETTDGEDLFLAQAAAEKSRRSYKDFLQRFSVLREEIGVDPEEFDLNYYTYGLKLYGNMPLMEPLESREVKKIREFVIAIDTSYSTSGTLVEQFLKDNTIDYSGIEPRKAFYRSVMKFNKTSEHSPTSTGGGLNRQKQTYRQWWTYIPH